MAEAAGSQECNFAPPPVRHENIHAASEIIERSIIEAEARELIQNRCQLPTVKVFPQERYDNARTALMEALTASGHLSTIEIEAASVEEINAQVLNRLLNGWDESLPTHEQSRRFSELCNELTIQKVHLAIVRGDLPPDTEVTEISDYPEALRGLNLGYRDSNRKGMIRTTSLRRTAQGYTRVIEQVSRSNGTWRSTFGFLSACNTLPAAGPPDVAALNTPIIHTRHDYADGVVDITRRLDMHAGKSVLYGDTDERVQHHPGYDSLRTESKRREEEIECYFEGLANLEEQLSGLLESGKITAHDRTQIFQEEILRVLDAICTLNPDYAEDTFGAESIVVFEQASMLVAQGRPEEAALLLKANEYLKEAVTFCGMTISLEKAKEMGLEVNSFGDLVDKGKESWKWKQGVCRVKACSSPKPTQVGPCSVCRRCQDQFDLGNDPTKLSAPAPKSSGRLGAAALFGNNEDSSKLLSQKANLLTAA